MTTPSRSVEAATSQAVMPVANFISWRDYDSMWHVFQTNDDFRNASEGCVAIEDLCAGTRGTQATP